MNHQFRIPGSPDNNLSSAAIVCGHVARNEHPICRAFHTEAVEDADSGWQFFCGSAKEEKVSESQVWALKEVIRREPSLADFLHLPVGFSIWRSSSEDPWQVTRG